MNKKLFFTLSWPLFLLIILLGACKLSLDPYKPQQGAAGVKFTLGSSPNNSTTNRAILSNSGYLYLISVKKEGATTIHGPFTPDTQNTIVIDNLEAGEYDHLFVFYSAKEFNLQKTLEKINAEGFSLELDSYPSLETALTNKNLINKLAQTYASKGYLLDFIFSDTFTGRESTNQTEQYISLLSHYFNGSTVFGQKSNLNLKAGKTETLALTLLPFANLHDIGPLPDNTFIINVQSEQEIERFISLPIATIFGESNTNFAIELVNSSDASLSDFAIYNQNGTKQVIDFSKGIESFNPDQSLEYTANLSTIAYFYVRSTGNLNFKLKAKPTQPTAALTFTNVAPGLEAYDGWFYVGFANEANTAIQGWLEASKNPTNGEYFIPTLAKEYHEKDMYLLYSLDKLNFEEKIGIYGESIEELLKNKSNIDALLDEIAEEASNEEALLLRLNGRALITHLDSSENTPNAKIDLNSPFSLRPIVASGEVSGNYYGEILIEPDGDEDGVDVLYSKPKFVKFSIDDTNETYWADCAIQTFSAFAQVLLYDSKGEFLRTIIQKDSNGYKKIDLLLNQTNAKFYVFIDGTLEQNHFYTSISVYEPQFVSKLGEGTGTSPDNPTTIQNALENLKTASNPIVFLTQNIELDKPLIFNVDVPVGNYSKLTITSWDSKTSSIASQALHRISPSSDFDGKSFLNFTAEFSKNIMMSFKYIHIGPEVQGQYRDMSLITIYSDKVTLNLENCVLQNNDKKSNEHLTYGGAIDVASGNLSISGTIIENCSANKGGGIYFSGKDFILYPGTEITNCKALKKPDGDNGEGGGIYVGGETAILYLHSGTSITGNHAENLGGGIYLEKTAKIMEGGDISGVTGNIADAGGDQNIYEEPDI